VACSRFRLRSCKENYESLKNRLECTAFARRRYRVGATNSRHCQHSLGRRNRKLDRVLDPESHGFVTFEQFPLRPRSSHLHPTQGVGQRF
jgi:hypothetical protein